MDIDDVDNTIQLLSDGVSIGKEEMQAVRWLRTRMSELEAEQKAKPMSGAPRDGTPIRVWCRTSDKSAAWFDARYHEGVWYESQIRHIGHGFLEKRGMVLRPSLFLPATPMPDQSRNETPS